MATRMDNPEALATLGTEDTGQRQTKRKRIKQHKKQKNEQHGSTKNWSELRPWKRKEMERLYICIIGVSILPP